MVEFSSYSNPMDRGYRNKSASDDSTNDLDISVKDIGQSVPMGIAAANVQGVAAKIKSGASALEIGFPGAVRGQRQAQTPEMFGKDQRQAFKEIAEVNEVSLTTHASYGIMGLAGMDQQGNFSKEHRKLAVDEIKKAIEFAGDAARGGSVVVHTGEYQRPISEEDWAFKDPNDHSKGHRFLHYGEEAERAVIRVVDERTGQVMTQVKKNQRVARPVWLKATEENEGWHIVTRKNEILGHNPGDKVYIHKEDYLDYEGNPLDITERVPVYDSGSGRFKVKYNEWEDFVEEAKERNLINSKKAGMSLEEYKNNYYYKRDSNGNSFIEPEEAFLRATLETSEGHSRGWALNYSEHFEEHKKVLDKLLKARDFYKKLEETVPEDEKWKLKKEAHDSASRYVGNLVPSDYKNPSEIMEDAIKSIRKSMEFEHQSSASQQQQAEDSRETQNHITSAKKYALNESFKSYAEAGIYAMDTTRRKHVENNPIMITMENIFPESYGAHPDELKFLIENSRKEMAEQLMKQRGLSEKQAEEAAATHIKATLDTGHLNMWRKYWQNDPKKSMDKNDEDFKNWMLKKTGELAEKGMIGNVHLTDNYGYQDDHLSPGEGTAPVKDIVAVLKKNGYKGALTVEPGADASTDLGDFWGLMKTWKLFGSPVYGAHGPVGAGASSSPKAKWGDIQYSYFGQANPPYYVFGPYSPSQDWTLFSQVPLE